MKLFMWSKLMKYYLKKNRYEFSSASSKYGSTFICWRHTWRDLVYEYSWAKSPMISGYECLQWWQEFFKTRVLLVVFQIRSRTTIYRRLSKQLTEQLLLWIHLMWNKHFVDRWTHQKALCIQRTYQNWIMCLRHCVNKF